MRRRLPKHLSYDYQLKLEEVPTKHADRTPLKVVMPGIILGLLMAVLGCFELTGGMYDPEGLGYTLDADTRAPLFSHTAVDAAFIIIGLGIVIGSIVSYVRYKKIFFNGKTFSVDLRGVFGENELFREFLRGRPPENGIFPVRHFKQKQIHCRAGAPRPRKNHSALYFDRRHRHLPDLVLLRQTPQHADRHRHRRGNREKGSAGT